jgi:UDP-N-acetylglucosamine diphosphorylase/glucosamine-1-phosphate N-acetyltransferase
MNYILFDDQKVREDFLPLTFTRPIADLRFGILTMREKWEHLIGFKTSTLTDDYLSKKFPLIKGEDNFLINSSICPSKELYEVIKSLIPNQALISNEKIIAMRLDASNLENLNTSDTSEIVYEHESESLTGITDLFSKLGNALAYDFEILTKGKKSQTLSSSNQIIGDNPVFLEEGAVVECSILNTKNGPIYIGKDAEVMEGSIIRGPFALGEHAQVKAGTKIYGPTSFGPHCKIGGEVNNSMIMGYTNKAHDGFLGNSILGEWCNLGAGTNCSNLKNTYDSVRIWNYKQETFVDTGLQFCGLIMGDHSKTSINTMLNTGTIVGVSVNLFGAGFPRQFVSSFNWGGFSSGFKKFNFKKAVEVAEKVYERRGKEFDEVEKEIFRTIFELTIV